MHTQNKPWAWRRAMAGTEPKIQTRNLIHTLSFLLSNLVNRKGYIFRWKKAGKLIRLMTAVYESVTSARDRRGKCSVLTKVQRHNQQDKQWRKHTSEKIWQVTLFSTNKQQVCPPAQHKSFSTVMKFIKSFRVIGETGHHYAVYSTFQHLLDTENREL